MRPALTFRSSRATTAAARAASASTLPTRSPPTDNAPRRSASPSPASAARARRGGGFTPHYTSAVPHHQSQGRGGGSGAHAAVRLMQRDRAHTVYYHHTVIPVTPTAAARGWAAHDGEEPPSSEGAHPLDVVSITARRSPYATTGRAAAAAAADYARDAPVMVEEVGSTQPPSTSPPGGVVVVVATDTHGTAARARSYEPFRRLLNRYLERGFVPVASLVRHPEAPPPAVLLDEVLQHRTPCQSLVDHVLLATRYGLHVGGVGGGRGANALALQRVAVTLRSRCAETLYARPATRALLADALLAEGLYTDAAAIVREVRDEDITPSLWASLMAAAAKAKLPDASLLGRLLRVGSDGTASEDALLTEAGVLAVRRALAPAPAAPQLPLGVRSATLALVTSEGATTGEQDAKTRSSATAYPHWVRLGSTTLGYAAAHYGGLSGATADDRGGTCVGEGQLRLHPSTRAYLADVAASMAYDPHRHRSPATSAAAAIASATVPAGADEAEAVTTFPGASALTTSARTSESADEEEGLRLLTRAAPAVVMGSNGIVYGLDAGAASQLLLRCGISFGGQAPPLLALHVMRRYLDSCHALRDEAARLHTGAVTQLAALAREERRWQGGAGGERSPEAVLLELAKVPLRGATPHPSPFLLFFRVLREARDFVADTSAGAAAVAATATTTAATSVAHEAAASSSSPRLPRAASLSPSPSLTSAAAPAAASAQPLPMMHWGLAWRYFQLLNRENPLWYLQVPEEAADLCLNVLEVLCRGADPWLSLNVARAASARHLVDGLEMSLWLLHHLDPSHHTEEARQVTRKIFRWLLVDVGVHLHARLHHHLIPVTRVLLRLGLQDELKVLYNAVLDNVYAFSENFRAEFIRVMSDLVCPSCSSILPSTDVYAERVCSACMTVVAPRDPATLPSFQLSDEHARRARERRRTQRAMARRRAFQAVDRLTTGGDGAQPPRGLAPHRDAAETFRRHVLQDAAPLLPGVTVSAELALFPVPDSEEGSAVRPAVLLDVRAAMEESSRRLALQRAARAYALAQRGLCGAGGVDSGAGPLLAQAALPSSALLDTAAAGAVPAHAAVHTRSDGPWTCVWCQQQNSAWSGRVQCGACGAETGPLAAWRHFAYAADGDVMMELRQRIANAAERPVDAVVAAYLLMLYRRTFLLRAVPHDEQRITQLVERLCLLHERVLAAYTYTRFVAPRARRKDNALLMLAQMFGGAGTEAYRNLRAEDLLKDDTFFEAVFTTATCKVCFGSHDWRLCPIITRDFASAPHSSINLSPEEKQRAILEHLHRAVRAATVRGREEGRLVVEAYAAFVTSPFRELFAEVHASATNDLSILLSEFKQYRRAAFVLCHVPLYARRNEAYTSLCGYFDVTHEEAMVLLAKRSSTPQRDPQTPEGASGGPPPQPPSPLLDDDSHPNLVQVTRTCCMCLDQRHASFDCPRLHAWLADVVKVSAATTNAAAASRSSGGGGGGGAPRAAPSSTTLVDTAAEGQQMRRLKAQVDGWTTAGPERLHAFYRFLLAHVDVLRPATADLLRSSEDAPASVAGVHSGRSGSRGSAGSASDPLVYAVNKTIGKLAVLHRHAYAYRLYARTPPACVAQSTTVAMLRMNRFSEEAIRAVLQLPSSAAAGDAAAVLVPAPAAARAAAVPLKNRCLLCFQEGHAFPTCPELTAQPTLAEKLRYVVEQVGGLCATPDGVTAAAAYVYHTYNQGLLSNEMMRASPPLVRSMLVLAERCFAVGRLAPGVRVLRRIPVEMVPPEGVYTSLWRAAGLPEATVEARRLELLALYDAEGLVPSVTAPPPRRTYASRFVSNLGHALHDELCRHCYAHGHTIATCEVFHEEVGFGRDYVASYRMSMMSEQLDKDWQDAYLLKLVDFFATHTLFMPYHIAGVANALNAIAAMWSFRGEPGIALAHLLRVPPAYRRRQAFKHILHCLQVPSAEIARVLAGYYFSPDDAHAAGSGGSPAQVGAQHLLMVKPAIRDVALETVFRHYPAAVAALEQSEQRMEAIRQRHRVPTRSATRAMHDILGTAAAGTEARTSSTTAPLTVMQSGDIARLREDFDPILTELEDAVGMKLGSRHVLFTSAIDILASAGASASTEPSQGHTLRRETHTSPLAAAFAAAAAAGGGGGGAAGVGSPQLTEVPPVREAEVVAETRHRGPGSGRGSASGSGRPSTHSPPPPLRSPTPQPQPQLSRETAIASDAVPPLSRGGQTQSLSSDARASGDAAGDGRASSGRGRYAGGGGGGRGRGGYGRGARGAHSRGRGRGRGGHDGSYNRR